MDVRELQISGLRWLIDSDSRSAVHLVIAVCLCVSQVSVFCVCGRCGAAGDQRSVIDFSRVIAETGV